MESIISTIFGLIWFGIFVLIGAVIAVFYFYNRLQGPSHSVREASSNIMVCMKKRVDLVNKLIDIASGYGDHEKLIHIAVSQHQSMINSFKESEAALIQVVAAAQTFPELHANQMYQQLMNRLEVIEIDLQNKREVYNSAVKIYNANRSSFPTVLIASKLGFKEAPYFNIENADALDNLKDFQTDDGTMLKAVLATAGKKIITVSKKFGSEANRVSRNILDKTKSNFPPRKEAQSFCSQCGAKVNPDSKFCNSCGNKIQIS